LIKKPVRKISKNDEKSKARTFIRSADRPGVTESVEFDKIYGFDDVAGNCELISGRSADRMKARRLTFFLHFSCSLSLKNFVKNPSSRYRYSMSDPRLFARLRVFDRFRLVKSGADLGASLRGVSTGEGIFFL